MYLVKLNKKERQVSASAQVTNKRMRFGPTEMVLCCVGLGCHLLVPLKHSEIIADMQIVWSLE